MFFLCPPVIILSLGSTSFVLGLRLVARPCVLATVARPVGPALGLGLRLEIVLGVAVRPTGTLGHTVQMEAGVGPRRLDKILRPVGRVGGGPRPDARPATRRPLPDGHAGEVAGVPGVVGTVGLRLVDTDARALARLAVVDVVDAVSPVAFATVPAKIPLLHYTGERKS